MPKTLGFVASGNTSLRITESLRRKLPGHFNDVLFLVINRDHVVYKEKIVSLTTKPQKNLINCTWFLICRIVFVLRHRVCLTSDVGSLILYCCFVPLCQVHCLDEQSWRNVHVVPIDIANNEEVASGVSMDTVPK